MIYLLCVKNLPKDKVRHIAAIVEQNSINQITRISPTKAFFKFHRTFILSQLLQKTYCVLQNIYFTLYTWECGRVKVWKVSSTMIGIKVNINRVIYLRQF